MNKSSNPHIIGIDLGGTQIKGVLLSAGGEVIRQQTLPTNDEPGSDWKHKVRALVEDLTGTISKENIRIGLSAPGLANAGNTAIAYMPDRLPGLENFIWTDYLGAPTSVLNDAHAALMAEAEFGAAKDCRNAILLTLGTGVGGGVLINGQLYQGQFQMAGHFGHFSVNANDDERSLLGAPGSLEYAIGNYSIRRRSFGKFNSTMDLLEAYRTGDAFARWLWLESVRKLAIGIASLSNAFSPEIVVLSGGITLAGDDLFQPLESFLEVYGFRPEGNKICVRKAHFAELSGAIGAAAFALKQSGA
ncbi:MAG TPA: ROK family protein [Flavilitoribacter sp.]|nr:ROK family protein [Flavilitoribacter sp.]HMQ87517.1 ROK family protein [Flavilitoribacter sp.]